MAPTLADDWQNKLAELKDGWDSYGGKPITTAAILALESFSVVPCSDGGIDLVSYRDGLELSIEIQPDGGFGHMLICKADPKPIADTGKAE